MSSFGYLNKENVHTNENPKNEKLMKQDTKRLGNNALQQRANLNTLNDGNVKGLKPQNPNALVNNSGHPNRISQKKKTLKKTNSLLLGDQGLKKKLNIQRDLEPEIKTVSKNVQTRQKLFEHDTDIEVVPEGPPAIPYQPENVPHLTESDLKFFQTRSPVPQKSGIQREVDLDSSISFDEIPEIEINIGQFEVEPNLSDSLIKKQPLSTQLSGSSKLDIDNIPNLHFESLSTSLNKKLESQLFNGTRSPSKRSYQEFKEEEEGLSSDDLQSLMM